MDDLLENKLRDFGVPVGDETKLDVTIEYLDEDGAINLVHGEKKVPYKLKPLKELYGVGHGDSVNVEDDTYLPLLLSIEEEIARFDAQHATTDGPVLLALQTLSMNPEQPSADPLTRGIQVVLRLSLSLNNYSRQEVRQAIRKVEKSVVRHHNGFDGYLKFIQAQFKQFRKHSTRP